MFSNYSKLPVKDKRSFASFFCEAPARMDEEGKLDEEKSVEEKRGKEKWRIREVKKSGG